MGKIAASVVAITLFLSTSLIHALEPLPGNIGWGFPGNLEATETDGKVRFTVQRNGGQDGSVSFVVSPISDTAKAGEDFDGRAVRVGFADGEGGAKVIEIPVIDDDRPELIEQFSLQIADPVWSVSPGGLFDDQPRTVQITSNDVPDFEVNVERSVLAGTALSLSARPLILAEPLDVLWQVEPVNTGGIGTRTTFTVLDTTVILSPAGVYRIRFAAGVGEGLVSQADFFVTAVDPSSPPPPPIPDPVPTPIPTAPLLSITVARPGRGEEIVIAKRISGAGHVRARVFNREGVILRTPMDSEQSGPDVSIHWDCRNDSNEIVAASAYYMVIEADGRTEKQTVVVRR